MMITPSKGLQSATEEATDGASAQTAANQTPHALGPTVLLIDDDGDHLLALERMLIQEKFIVFTAVSATDALEMLARTTVDVIVSDLNMPRMNGFDLLEQIRARNVGNAAKDIPIIALSACAENVGKVAREFGADLFCEKRHARTKLPEQIHCLLNR